MPAARAPGMWGLGLKLLLQMDAPVQGLMEQLAASLVGRQSGPAEVQDRRDHTISLRVPDISMFLP